MNKGELAKEIIIKLNMVYGCNLPKSAVDVVVLTIEEQESNAQPCEHCGSVEQWHYCNVLACDVIRGRSAI